MIAAVALIRFFDKLDMRSGLGPEGECWEWRGGAGTSGHGRFWNGKKLVPAHKFAWEMVYGPMPPGLVSLHTCDHPPCCRVDHIVPGTQKQNLNGARAKGRMAMRPPNRELI